MEFALGGCVGPHGRRQCAWPHITQAQGDHDVCLLASLGVGAGGFGSVLFREARGPARVAPPNEDPIERAEGADGRDVGAGLGTGPDDGERGGVGKCQMAYGYRSRGSRTQPGDGGGFEKQSPSNRAMTPTMLDRPSWDGRS